MTTIIVLVIGLSTATFLLVVWVLLDLRIVKNHAKVIEHHTDGMVERLEALAKAKGVVEGVAKERKRGK